MTSISTGIRDPALISIPDYELEFDREHQRLYRPINYAPTVGVPASHSSGLPYTGIPDEVFTIVVAHVPYTRQQHGILRLVNERFKDTVDSVALPLEVARQRFPEQVALQDLRTVASREELDDLAQYERQLDHAVQKIGQCQTEQSSKTMKHLLSNGLRLLDHITGFTTNPSR